MLNIYVGSRKDEIYNTSVYFDHTYLDFWLEDPFSQKMIKAIDKAEVIAPQTVRSKYLGVIPATKLSGGVKTLLLLQHDHKHFFNASTCGDNCAKWILKLAKKSDEDINVTLHHIMDFGDKDFAAMILNTQTIVHNRAEYLNQILDLLHKGDNDEG